MYSSILLVDDHDEVVMYLPARNKQASLYKQTKIIQEVVSPEVCK